MLRLIESIKKNLNEYTFGQFIRKQKSITNLFPQFNKRTADVNKNGGIRLNEMLPEGVWHFKVNSGTKAGTKYDVYMKFKNLPEMIKKYAGNRKLWKKDNSGVSYPDLAAEIFNAVDLEMDCSCPSDLYHGFEYIKTRKRAQYGDQENRPPKKKNPRQYGVQCKHAHNVFVALPFYVVTLASYLKKYYAKEVGEVENKTKDELVKLKAGTDYLAKKEEEQNQPSAQEEENNAEIDQ